MNKLYMHFKTITHHKIVVTKLCFDCGLYKQGILHDLSKYSWVEFHNGVKYYQGNRSPIDAEKEAIGYSNGWLHHKGRNKHHWEYYLDSEIDKTGTIRGVDMPKCYIAEMVCDRIGACKIYQKDKYTDASPLNYWLNGKSHTIISKFTSDNIEFLLTYLRDNGLEATTYYIKHTYLKG
ncbi:MAG: DUF5662 family protein [Erysipelotrichaceae bacterium]